MVHFLVRPGSEDKLEGLYDYWGLAGTGRSRALSVSGDLTAKKLGVSNDKIKALKGSIVIAVKSNP